MKKIILFIVFLNSFFCFSQENKSYSFDSFTSFIETFYGKNNQRYNCVIIRNENNKNYQLTINNNLKSASLFDFDINKVFHFKLKYRIENVQDLKQLDTAFYNSNSKLINLNNKIKNDYKDAFEEVEFERDTIQKKFIVHKISYKNNKKKKILDEHFYIFRENPIKNTIEKSKTKGYLSEKFNVPFIESDCLEKIIEVEDGKKVSETEYITTKNENIILNFILKETNNIN